jgi:hypothetical protein
LPKVEFNSKINYVHNIYQLHQSATFIGYNAFATGQIISWREQSNHVNDPHQEQGSRVNAN